MLVPFLNAVTLALAPAPQIDWLDAFLAGSRALEEGELAVAEEWLERALEELPENAPTAWALAGVAARRGDADAAFRWLAHAVAEGGGEASLLEWDPDLEALREDERFKALLEELRARDAGRSDEPFPAELAFRLSGYAISATDRAERVLVGRGGSTFLLDLRANETLGVLDRPGEDMSWVELDPRGRWAAVVGSTATAEREHFLRIFDARTGDLERELDEVGWQATVECSRDGARLYAHGGAFETQGVLYDTTDWTPVWTLPGGTDRGHTHLSPDGKLVLALTRQGAEACGLELWNVEDGSTVLDLDGIATIPNTNLGFSSDGQLLFLLENVGNALRVFDARTGSELVVIEQPDSPRLIQGCFLGATGELVALDEAGSFHVFDARSGEELRSFESGSEGWQPLAANADGSLLFVSAWSEPVRALDTWSGEVLWSTGNEGGHSAVRFSPDETRVILDERRAAITVRDVRDGTVVSTLQSPALDAVVRAHPTRAELWVGAQDGSLRRVSTATGRTLACREGTGRAVRALSFDAGGERVAVVDEAGTLAVVAADELSVELEVEVAQRIEDRWRVQEAAFAHSGSVLIVSETDSSLAFYSATDGELRGRIETGERFASWTVSRDGRLVAVDLPEHRVGLFDAASGESVREIALESSSGATLAFDPAGEQLWIGTPESEVHVAEVATGELLRTLDLSDLDVFDSVEVANIAFRDDGELALTVSSGFGVVAAWHAASGERAWSYSYTGGNPAPLHCAFGESGERAYVWGQGRWSPRIVSATDGETLLDLASHELWGLLPLTDESVLAARGPRGLQVLDADSGAVRWARLELAEGGWLLSAPTNHFDGTRAALESLHVVLEERSYPLDALAAALLDPKRVQAAAAGVELLPARLPEIPRLDWAVPMPRVVRLAEGEEPPVLSFDAVCADGIRGFEVVRDGVRELVGADALDELRLAAPAEGASVDYRFRAVSARGVLSRALHLSLER